MATTWARDRRQLFYLGIGVAGIAAALIGFFGTYLAPIARGTFEAPAIVHVHGLLAMAWLLLFTVQCFLVRRGDTKLHMALGLGGLPLAIGILVSGVFVGRWTVERDLATLGEFAFAGFFGTFTSLSLFLLLVAASLLLRHRADWHKRLMLLATVVVLWPAWFRWRHLFPAVPNPDIVFALLVADLPILIAAVRDRLRYGAVHPAWLFVGPAVFLEQLFETLSFANGGFPGPGRWLYGLME